MANKHRAMNFNGLDMIKNKNKIKGLIDYVESEKEHRQQAIKLFDKGYKHITKN